MHPRLKTGCCKDWVVASRGRRPAVGEPAEGLRFASSEQSKAGDSELLNRQVLQCLCSWE